MREIKERPLCRKAILDMELSPLLVNGVWNGKRAVGKDGRQSSLSDGMKRQMRKMVQEGAWGPIRTGRGHNFFD